MARIIEPQVTFSQALKVPFHCVTIGYMKKTPYELFSERFNEALDGIGAPPKHKGRQSFVANMFGVSQKGARKWLEGEAIPRTSRFPDISSKVKKSTEWLLSLDSAEGANHAVKEPSAEYGPIVGEYRAAPIVGTAQLGDDGYWYETEYPVGHGEGYVDVPTKDPNAYSLRVRGQSMAPAIRDGWLVVCEPNKEPVVSEYVMVKTTDGRSMVKELLYSKAEGVTLLSVNDAFGCISLTWDEIDKIHAVSFIVPPSKIRL